MTTPLLLLCILAALAGCRKDAPPNPPNTNPNPNPIDSPVAPPKAYSYWKVGNDSFKSNNVEKTIGKLIALLSCWDDSNRFGIEFHFGALPTHGDFPLSHSAIQHPDSVALVFYYKGLFYVPYGAGYLHRDTGGKFQAYLQPTWYANKDNPLDTVLISGVFREP